MDISETIEKHYFHENDRRRDLNDALSVPLAIISALLAAIITFLKEVTPPFSYIEIALVVSCSPAIIAALVGITNLARTTIGYSYHHPCDPGALYDWYLELLDAGNSVEEANGKCASFLIREYAACAGLNCKNNDLKAYYLHQASINIVICLSFLIVAAVPYLLVVTEKGAATQQSANMLEAPRSAPDVRSRS